MKKIFVFLFFSFIFFTKPVFAGNDITITCDSSQCSQNSVLPLFSETNIYPGFSTSQNLFIDNNRNDVCHLTFKGESTSSVPNVLSSKILINISGVDSDNNYLLTDYLLSDLLDPSKSAVSLGDVDKNDQNTFLWTTSLMSDADNTFANLSSNFNININFTCDDEPFPIATPGQTLGITTTTSSSNQTCTNSYPAAPTAFVATLRPDGNVYLTWDHTISDHTGYLIAFGTSSGNYLYGAPDVGNVTNYTVQSLTPGAQYCFYVRSLNGCMPGDRTSEYCVNPGSTIIPVEIIPTDFQPGVLGVDTDEENLTTPTPSEQPAGNILGSSDDTCKGNWLPLLFIVALILNLIYIKLPTKDIFIPIIISLMTYLIDNYLLKSRCCLFPNIICNYFWVGYVLSCLIPLSLKLRKRI